MAAKAKKEKQTSLLGENTKVVVSIPKADHQAEYKKVLASYTAKATLPGFRQGKAPTALVEDTIGKQKLLGEVFERLFPAAYTDAIQKQDVHPFVSPQVDIKELDAEKDWQVDAYTAIAPEVSVTDWEKTVKEAAKTFPKPEKKEEKEHDHDHEHDHKHDHEAEVQNASLSYIFGKLIEKISPKVAPLLLENETRRQLEEFAKQLASHRIELETYLSHMKKSIEELQQEYMAQSLTTLQIEFILLAITEQLAPTVEEKEIVKLAGPSYEKLPEKSKERIREEATLMLKRRKTLDRIMEVAGIKTA